MIAVVILRKILLFFAPIVVFYILRKIGKNNPNRKSQHLNIDKSNIVEGKIVKDKK